MTTKPWAVIAGCFLGTAVWLLLMGVWLGQELSDSAPPVNYFREAAIPVVAAIALLIFPRTRRAWAGLVFGLAVTTVVWAGLGLAFAVVGGLSAGQL